MQIYSDRKFDCDFFTYSHTSYNFVLHILFKLIYFNRVTHFNVG